MEESSASKLLAISYPLHDRLAQAIVPLLKVKNAPRGPVLYGLDDVNFKPGCKLFESIWRSGFLNCTILGTIIVKNDWLLCSFLLLEAVVFDMKDE